MPINASFKELTKTDRRKQWKDLKTKHSKAIAKAKLDFDLKLGPALDKYQTQVDKLAKLAATVELNSNQIEPVMNTLGPLETIVASYHDKVKTLDEPAKKELTALLTAIDTDGREWKQLAASLWSQMPTAPTDAQKVAARAFNVPTQNIRLMAVTIVTRGERATAFYTNNKPTARTAAAALASNMVAAARLVGPSAHELGDAASQVVAGSNYELFKTRAKAALGLLQRFKAAAEAFHAKWNIALDDMTIASDTDAVALNGNYQQIVADCDHLIGLIAKLP